jgi:hypothetical protein
LPARTGRRDAFQRRLDFGLGQRQIAGRLVAEEQSNLAHQLAKHPGRGIAVAHQRQFVLDQRVIDDRQVGRHDPIRYTRIPPGSRGAATAEALLMQVMFGMPVCPIIMGHAFASRLS